jgi:hypothetical protein
VPGAVLLLPDIECPSPGRTVDAGCRSVPTRAKVVIDKRVRGEETLGLPRFLEPLHLAFVASGRSKRRCNRARSEAFLACATSFRRTAPARVYSRVRLRDPENLSGNVLR